MRGLRLIEFGTVVLLCLKVVTVAVLLDEGGATHIAAKRKAKGQGQGPVEIVIIVITVIILIIVIIVIILVRVFICIIPLLPRPEHPPLSFNQQMVSIIY